MTALAFVLARAGGGVGGLNAFNPLGVGNVFFHQGRKFVCVAQVAGVNNDDVDPQGLA